MIFLKKIYKINQVNYLVAVAGILFLAFSSCTQDITVDIPAPQAKIVVEGSIEQGLPPIISLTSTVPFYGEVNFNELDNYYVHDALVTVSDGINTVVLTEYCLADLPEEILPLIAGFLGVDLDTTGDFAVNICLYTVPDIFTGDPEFVGEIGKTYSLNVQHGENSVSSSTVILPPVPPDSIYFKPHDDPLNDTLVRLYIHLTDPPAQGDFYRYFTKRNNEGFYSGFSSVFDDNLINGQSFDFTVDRGFNPTEDFDPEVYGYFWTGDTVILKWCTVDYAAFNFWRTLEFDGGSDGPFSSATIAQTNIIGGLGIWCGYGVSYDTLYIPE